MKIDNDFQEAQNNLRTMSEIEKIWMVWDKWPDRLANSEC